MTLHEAYIKAKVEMEVRAKTKKWGPLRIEGCRDYGDFWGFGIVPLNYDEDDESTWFADRCDITVNKQTGAIGHFTTLMDFDLAMKSKPVPIEQFIEKAAVA